MNAKDAITLNIEEQAVNKFSRGHSGKAGMTVREAFEKAGYPVPGERVVLRTWTAVWETHDSMTGVSGTGAEERSCWQCYGSKEHDSLIAEYVFREAGWQRDRYCREIPYRSMTVDISNLPAIDAIDALPACVQKVVKP